MARFSKKGQIGTMELLMIMVIIGIIIAIGIYLFYGEFIKKTSERGRELNEQERSVLIGMIGRLPEVQCSKNMNDEDYCIDATKLIGAKNTIRSNMDYYSAILGYRDVRIELVYPSKNSAECDKDNYPTGNCGVFEIYENQLKNYKSKESISILVSIYYPNEGKYRVGRLIIEQYSI